jgi:quercetin dioxygenase-like cupin family protein
MNVVHLYADPAGESHLDDVALPVGSNAPATACSFVSLPPGFDTGWHPSASRWIVLYLAGEIEVESSDGARRRFSPGDVTIADDTTGKGHRSRVVGEGGATFALVEIPEA